MIPESDRLFFVELACGKTRHSCYYFAKVYVRGSFCPTGFVWAFTPTSFMDIQNYLTQFLSLRRRSAIFIPSHNKVVEGI